MKKLSKKILFLFSTILIFLPLFYYGLTDIEEYNLSFFTSNYYYNRSSLLATFIDFYWTRYQFTFRSRFVFFLQIYLISILKYFI